MGKSKHDALRKALGGGYYVPINLNVVDLVGSYEAAALLTRIIYWQDIAKGEFYKSNEEWYDELRLSEWQLREAKKAIAKYVTITRRGMPARNYYNVDMDALDEALASTEETSEQDLSIPHDSTSQNLTTRSEESSTSIIRTNDTTNDTTKSDVVPTPDKPKKPIDDEAYGIVLQLDRLIATRLPNRHRIMTTTQRDKAALEIERLHRIDGYEYKLIEGIMRWSQQDSFWADNILSAATLRKQFDKLYLKAKSEHDKKQATVAHIS